MPHRLVGIEVRRYWQPPRITHRQHQHGDGFAVALRHTPMAFLAPGRAYAERADAVA